LKISYGLRAFGIYFVILGSLIWFTLDNAVERLNDGMRQSAESVLVDMAHILAATIEDELTSLLAEQSAQTRHQPSPEQLARIFSNVLERKLDAQIYQVTKTSIDTQVYVTNQQGMVVYDSSGMHAGEDFSAWRDVSLSLEGKYGARTSYIDQNHTEPDDPKAMVVAAPLKVADSIIGVVSVLKPINSLEGHLLTETKQLRRYAFALLGLALVLGYLLSLWFTNSLNKIATYANNMADGKRVKPPVLRDNRLSELSNAISYMRSQLDGKEYVENYIHSLTHELKTPITSIHGAVELLSEDMPREDRIRFLNNISTSNQRMSRLVERMLSLAKLEGLTELMATSEFDIAATIDRLIEERSPTLRAQGIEVKYQPKDRISCTGDKVLISQAVANLLDNAISFCSHSGVIKIEIERTANNFMVQVFNQGENIPEFALDKLFDRFFSLPSPGKSQSAVKSTGLGLSFVREIMKLHKGTVKINNIKGGVMAQLVWPLTRPG
jgi:two-component system sensor histidine kinase CreC